MDGLQLCGLRIPFLLFVDGDLLFVLSFDLQLILGCFAAECEVAWMGISTSKSEETVLSWKSLEGLGKAVTSSGGSQVSQGLVHKLREKGAGDWRTDWGNVNSVADAKSVRCGKERAGSEAESLNLSVILCSNPHFQPWALGSDRNNEIMKPSGWDEFPLKNPLKLF